MGKKAAVAIGIGALVVGGSIVAYILLRKKEDEAIPFDFLTPAEKRVAVKKGRDANKANKIVDKAAKVSWWRKIAAKARQKRTAGESVDRTRESPIDRTRRFERELTGRDIPTLAQEEEALREAAARKERKREAFRQSWFYGAYATPGIFLESPVPRTEQRISGRIPAPGTALLPGMATPLSRERCRMRTAFEMSPACKDARERAKFNELARQLSEPPISACRPTIDSLSYRMRAVERLC